MARILVVEDEDLLRWSLAHRLEGRGHEVSAVKDLAGVERALGGHRPDLVLLDVCLPDGNGLDFLERNHQRLRGTAVLVMSAVGGSRESQRAVRLGAKAFITKPVEHRQLLDLVERCLG